MKKFVNKIQLKEKKSPIFGRRGRKRTPVLNYPLHWLLIILVLLVALARALFSEVRKDEWHSIISFFDFIFRSLSSSPRGSGRLEWMDVYLAKERVWFWIWFFFVSLPLSWFIWKEDKNWMIKTIPGILVECASAEERSRWKEFARKQNCLYRQAKLA